MKKQKIKKPKEQKSCSSWNWTPVYVTPPLGYFRVGDKVLETHHLWRIIKKRHGHNWFNPTDTRYFYGTIRQIFDYEEIKYKNSPVWFRHGCRWCLVEFEFSNLLMLYPEDALHIEIPYRQNPIEYREELILKGRTD